MSIFGPHELWTPDTPLSEVWKHNEECLDDESGIGGVCPACTQDIKRRRETLYAACIRCLAIMWRLGGTTELVSLPAIRAEQARITGHAVQQTNDWTKNINRLRFWELAEPIKTPGQITVWRCLPYGKEFLFGHARIDKIAWTFNSQVLDFDGPAIDVSHVKDIHFNLQKFFRGEL